VNHHSTNGDLLRGVNSNERIVEQGDADPVALLTAIDGETGENCNRDWELPRQSLACLGRRLVVFDLTRDERVVAIDGSAIGRGYKCSRSVAPLILSGIADQPPVQQLVAAAES